MKPLNKATSKVLAKLVAGLDVGEAKKIDNTNGTFMAVHVDCIGDNQYAVAHYFTQNGDAMADPDMTFYKDSADNFYPMSITQAAMGIYREVAAFGPGGTIEKYAPRGYAELRSFATSWMRNIKSQQGV